MPDLNLKFINIILNLKKGEETLSFFNNNCGSTVRKIIPISCNILQENTFYLSVIVLGRNKHE